MTDTKNAKINQLMPLIISKNLEILTRDHKTVVFVFIGTDANVGDSLGPLCGTLLNYTSYNIYTYGSLNAPITAKEVPFVANFIKKTHPTSFVVVVDAALGKSIDVGEIKVLKEGIYPGAGVNRSLPKIGDASIIGVVGEKCVLAELNLKTTRISTVYDMAKTITDGINRFISSKERSQSRIISLKRDSTA